MNKKPTIIYTWGGRGASLGHALFSCRSFGLSLRQPTSTWRLGTFPRRTGSWRYSPTTSTRSPARFQTLWPSWVVQRSPEANIIKLPNISASVPQLRRQSPSFRRAAMPFPTTRKSPSDDEGKASRLKYDKVKGSAVNPVLREGNSDRRVAEGCEKYAKSNPHSMGAFGLQTQTLTSRRWARATFAYGSLSKSLPRQVRIKN